MTKQPNILLFVPDGMQAKPLQSDHPCITPNFDRLTKRGLKFNKAYTPLPTCSPARSSLMTGLLPHNHGVLTVEHATDDDQSCLRLDKPHFAQHLVEAGYQTAYFGKWHIERTNNLKDFGWQTDGCDKNKLYRDAHKQIAKEEYDHLDPEISRWFKGPDGYRDLLHYAVTDLKPSERRTAVPGKLAGDFLDKAMLTDRPWCCCVSYHSPNESMIASRETYEKYDLDDIKLPENFHDTLKDKPNIYRKSQQVFNDITEKQWKQALACYYSRITEVDHELGLLIKNIEDEGQLDHTIIIVTTDHGKYVSSHGFDAHNYGPFEEIYNIPLIIAGPDIAKNQQTNAHVALHDLCPTICDLTGIKPINTTDSKSLAPLLQNPDKHEADFNTAYAEYHGTRTNLTQRILWQNDWKFVFNGFDFDELYNLKDDPNEMINLASLPQHQDRKRDMMKQIWQRVHHTHDKALIGAHYFPMRYAPCGPLAGLED